MGGRRRQGLSSNQIKSHYKDESILLGQMLNTGCCPQTQPGKPWPPELNVSYPPHHMYSLKRGWTLSATQGCTTLIPEEWWECGHRRGWRRWRRRRFTHHIPHLVESDDTLNKAKVICKPKNCLDVWLTFIYLFHGVVSQVSRCYLEECSSLCSLDFLCAATQSLILTSVIYSMYCKQISLGQEVPINI